MVNTMTSNGMLIISFLRPMSFQKNRSKLKEMIVNSTLRKKSLIKNKIREPLKKNNPFFLISVQNMKKKAVKSCKLLTEPWRCRTGSSLIKI